MEREAAQAECEPAAKRVRMDHKDALADKMRLIIEAFELQESLTMEEKEKRSGVIRGEPCGTGARCESGRPVHSP